MLPRARILPLLALAAVPLGAAAPAQAKLSQARFTATFDATYKTEWKEPKFFLGGSCFRRNFRSGTGSETWQVRSKPGAKVLAFDNGYATQMQFGSFTMNADTDILGIPAKGIITRANDTIQSWTGGDCGGDSGVQPQPADKDCGTRLVEQEVAITVNRGELTPDVTLHGNGVREKTGFEHCSLPQATVLNAGTWPAVSAKISKKLLFGGQKTIELTGKDQWKETLTSHNGAGQLTTASSMTWKLKLTRVKKGR
jgi:hypothetical protein